MSRATRVGSAVAGFVLAAGMLAGAPVARAETVVVPVRDSTFPAVRQAVAGEDQVVFWLANDAQFKHTVTWEKPGLPRHEFDPAAPREPFSVTFDTPDTYAYYCEYHGKPGGVGMSGIIQVAAAPEPTTTTTTAPPTTTTTTTTAPPTTTTTAPPTTTTRPAPTTTAPPATTTTRPPTTTAPTTATTARGGVKGASEPTTTTKPKSTSTTKAKKKKKSTTTSAPEAEETTTTLPGLPSLAAAAPPPGAPELPAPPREIPDATESGEEASSWVGEEKGGRGGGNGKKLLIGLGGLGTLGLAGGGWRWYHRSSRYLPA